VEPLSVLAMASTAFNGVQKLISSGREIEDVALHLGRWYGYAADLKEMEKQSEKPPIFRKLLDKGSVEAEALNSVICQKKIQEQERHIRDLIVVRYGIDTYREMIQMRRDIKKRRERTVYAQKRRRRAILDIIAILVGASVVVVLVYWFYTLLTTFKI